MIKNLKFKKITSCLVLGCFFSSLAIPAATAATISGNEDLNVNNSEGFYQIENQVTTSGNITQIQDEMHTTYAATTFGNVDQIINQAREIQINKTAAQVRKEEPRLATLLMRGFANPSKSNFELKDTRVEVLGSPSITYEETVYIGHSLLQNNSNTDQTLTTQSFSETVEDTLSTTTTHSIGTSVSASGNFNLPFVGSSGLSITSSYDFSKSNTNTTSKAITHTVEPQRILVPANSSVEVTVMLNKAKVKGNVALKGKLTGRDSGNVLLQIYSNAIGWTYGAHRDYTFTLAEMANNYGGNKGSMEQGTYFFGIVPNADGSINIEGKGTFEGSVGAQLVVHVKDLKSGKTGEIKLNGSPTIDKGQSGVYPTNVGYLSEEEITVPGFDYIHPADRQVQLFKDADYKGTRVVLDEGRYTYSQFSEIGNDNLSSIKVPGDYTVTLFENTDFTGRKVKLSGDSTFLGDFNDMASSMIIAKGKVLLYENEEQISAPFPPFLTLGEGRYKYRDFGIEPGRIRTVLIPKMYTVIFYENEDFTGLSRTYTKNVLKLDAFGSTAESFEITTELEK